MQAARLWILGVALAMSQVAPAQNSGTPAHSIPVSLDPAHSRPFQPYFFGSNSGHLRNAFNWDDPGFQQALRGLNFLKTLRFPAGELANFWDWKSGMIDSYVNDKDKPDKESNAFPAPLGELKTELEVTKAEPLFVLNMLTDPVCGNHCKLTPSSPNLGYQMQMLDAAHSMGINLKLLELGNEYYIPKDTYEAVYPDPSNGSQPDAAVLYGRLCTQWIKAIKAKYPDAKISVVGAHINDKPTDRKAKWLPGLFDASLNTSRVGGDGRASLQGADAVTLHVYPGAGLPAAPILDMEGAEQLLGAAFKQWDEIKHNDLPLIPKGMPIWFTEFNLHNSDKVPLMGTWAQGLVVATMSLLFLEDSRVQMETHHELVGNAGYGDIFYTADSFSHVDGGEKWNGPPLQTKQWGKVAMADALNVIAEAADGATQAQMLTFAGTPTITSTRSSITYPALYGWSFSHRSSRSIVILNLCNRALSVDVAHLISSGNVDEVFGNPATFVTGGLDGSPSRLNEVRSPLVNASVLTLRPFSIMSVTP